MSQDNVEIVRRLYEVINRFGAEDAPQVAQTGRLDMFFSLFDPEIEFQQLSGLIGTGAYRGYEGLLQAARDLADAFGSVEFVVERYFSEGSLVVTDARARAAGRTTALPTEIPISHLFELRNDRVARWVVYPSVQEALEAAGLSE